MFSFGSRRGCDIEAVVISGGLGNGNLPILSDVFGNTSLTFYLLVIIMDMRSHTLEQMFYTLVQLFLS